MAELTGVIVGLADDLGLELLNTLPTPVLGAEPVELIPDGAAYLSWLTWAGFVETDDATLIRARFDAGELDAVAAEARELRECLRPNIIGCIAAPRDPVPGAIVDTLNALLALDRRFAVVRFDGPDLTVSDDRRWEESRQLLVPPADGAARLLAEGDFGLVRQCEGCTLLFHDRTKAHRRRWCSMALCGNREKARRHRAQRSGA